MSRSLIVLVLATGVVHAETAAVDEAAAQPDPSDQIIGASLAMVVGGRVTPGGVRLSGHYHYQLSEQDWFDGRASFTYGSSAAECFRDRADMVICDHGLVDGKAVEVSANVRRFFATGEYMPFARLGVGIALVRFGDDDVTGIAFPVHAGGGLRVVLTDLIAVTAEAELEIGFGLFNRGLGTEPQLGGSIGAGAEFRL